MTDIDFMALALDQARMAAALGEVPVGAVLVQKGQVIAIGRNALISGNDPTAHAEITVLREAAKFIGNYRLNECELFVTLEPCAMCSGAILNARLKRVVFGAFEPKSGAAGSIINLFEQTALNHQTECKGGILAEESRSLLQDFFRQRRVEQRTLAKRRHPLRDDALRTPNTAFMGLPGYPWKPNYRSDLPALNGLRMHYVDEQIVFPGININQEPITYLCLHDFSDWSYSNRNLIASLLQSGNRVIAPDLIGFGKSDKPKKAIFHTLAKHRQILVEFVDALDLFNVVLVLPKWQSFLGLSLPVSAPMRYRGLKQIKLDGSFFEDEQTLSQGLALWNETTLYQNDYYSINLNELKKVEVSYQNPEFDAPFPDPSYRKGVCALENFEKILSDMKSSGIFHETEQFWISVNKC